MIEPTATGDWSTPHVATPSGGITIPGYEVLAELGRGGMGVVYQARHLRMDRLVALKVIRDGALASQQDRIRFRIEAEAASRVRHGNIVEIVDVGEHEGRPYFAMELLEGGSLAEALAGQPQPAACAAELIRTLARAVDHAHRQRIVHRDLKPANVLLADCRLRLADSRGQQVQSASRNLQSAIPKIADFGLAKRLDSDSTALTQDGAVLGTASYMAPEQAAGRIGDIGPAVDIYALGAMLYELLTGRPPFQADSWSATLDRVLHEEPAPPRLVQADVPVNLETICLKCLEKEPARRYASGLALADDLDRFLAGQAVAAIPLSAHERLARLAARDGFEILEEVGHGPRSVVYRALSGSLKQPIALKVFTAGITTREEWNARLRRGAELWAALAHPQLTPVQRAGWWDTSPYVVTDYLPQGSLAAKLADQAVEAASSRSGEQRVQRALRLVAQLAEIISYLHRQGVIHANLKPSNVLFAADGIPRLVDIRLTGGLFVTPHPSVAGEPELKWQPSDDADTAALRYLPPEYLRDPDAAPRPYTDVYGLGLILYECLTGRPAFAATTARETTAQIAAQNPELPVRLNPDVPAKLEAVCLRCLHKNPYMRYVRVYDLITRLQACQDNPSDLPMHNDRRLKRPPLPRTDTPRPGGTA